MLQDLLLRDNGYILKELMPAFNEMRCEFVEIEDGLIVGVHATDSIEVLERQGYFFVGRRRNKNPVGDL